MASNDDLAKAKEICKQYNQSHLFKYEKTLKEDELSSLVKQILSIDFSHISNLYKQAFNKSDNNNDNTDESKTPAKDDIKPFPLDSQFNIYKSDEKINNDSIIEDLNDVGLRSIYNGECGIIILAGGQGTRLGSKDPKGLYNIGLPSNKSIFQLHFEKAIKVKQLAFDYVCNDKNNNKDNSSNAKQDSNAIYLPLYIMTSPNTHGKTEEYLVNNNYFGYNSKDVKIFMQDVYPCLDDSNGAAIMSLPHKIETSPNGNGGIYTTLDKCGILDEMIKNGLQYVQVFGIDNVLAKIGDPLWFGHCVKEKVDVSNKTCTKAEPHEKLGVMCLRNDKASVIEYSEITKEMAEMRHDNGDLVYGCGNLAMHSFSVEFLKKVVRGDGTDNNKNGFLYQLPIHVAIKKIPFWDETNNSTVKPDTPNGCKLEYFIFDTFMFANKITTFNISRREEFSPVKNAKGGSSPQSARQDISKFWKNKLMQITNNNVKFENKDSGNDNNDEDALLEVSNLLSYNGEGKELLDKVNGKTLQLPMEIS